MQFNAPAYASRIPGEPYVSEAFCYRHRDRRKAMAQTGCLHLGGGSDDVMELNSLFSVTVALPRSRIELETWRKSPLQVLDENAHFSGHPAAGRPHGKDRHSSLQRSKKTHNRTFSEFCSEEPCRYLGNP